MSNPAHATRIRSPASWPVLCSVCLNDPLGVVVCAGSHPQYTVTLASEVDCARDYAKGRDAELYALSVAKQQAVDTSARSAQLVAEEATARSRLELTAAQERWEAVSDLDSFFARVYAYYRERGLYCILAARIISLLSSDPRVLARRRFLRRRVERRQAWCHARDAALRRRARARQPHNASPSSRSRRCVPCSKARSSAFWTSTRPSSFRKGLPERRSGGRL